MTSSPRHGPKTNMQRMLPLAAVALLLLYASYDVGHKLGSSFASCPSKPAEDVPPVPEVRAAELAAATESGPVPDRVKVYPEGGMDPDNWSRGESSPRNLPKPSRPIRGPMLPGCLQKQPQPTPKGPFPRSKECAKFMERLGIEAAWFRPRKTRKLEPMQKDDFLYDRLYEHRGPLSPEAISGRVAWDLWYGEEFKVRDTQTIVDNYAGRNGGDEHTLDSILLTTSKPEFANRAKEFARRRGCELDEFHPETFDLDCCCGEFLNVSPEEQRKRTQTLWIHKPTYELGGDGIQIRNYTWFQRVGCGSVTGAAQHYIDNPLLLGGRKFDLRSYLLVASMDPMVVLYKHGFIRVSIPEYDPNSTDRKVHLVNTKVQQAKTDCEILVHWQSPTQLADDLVRRGLAPDNWGEIFRNQCKELSLQGFRSMRHLYHPGFLKDRFLMFGVDIMLDDNLKPWLIEFNAIPAISVVSDYMFNLMTDAAKEKIDIVSEINIRTHRGMPIKDLCTPRTFELIYSEDRENPVEFVPDAKCVGQPLGVNNLPKDS